MDAPDQMNQAQPTAIGEQFLANGGAPQPSSDPNAAPAPVAQPTPQTAAPAQAAPAPNPRHTAIGKMFSAITGGGSGTSASQLWRGIIGGALVGMGAAEDGPVIHGPYGDVKDHSIGGAASRGFQAGMNLRQQQQDRQRKQAQEDQESKIELDKATMAKAANARAQTTSIEASVRHGLDVQRLKQDVARGDEEAADRSRAKVAQSAIQQSDYFNLLNQAGAETLKVDGKPAEFDSAGDAEEAAHKQPGFYISGFLTRTTIDPSTGKLVIYKVPDKELDYTIKDPSTGDVHTVHTLPENYLRHRK